MTNRPQAEGRPGPGSSLNWYVAWVVPPDLDSPTMQWGISLIVSTLNVVAIKPGLAYGILSESDRGQFSMSRSHVAPSEQACAVTVIITQGYTWDHS